MWHRQAARVALLQLEGMQRDDVGLRGLQLDVGRPGALHGVIEPHTRSSKDRRMRWTESPPARVANSGTGGCTPGQMPFAPAISQNILVASARTEAKRWWESVPTRATLWAPA